MADKPQSPRDLAKQLTLWQWGLFAIIVGVLGNMLQSIVDPLTPPLSNAERGEAFGRGLVTALAVLTGVVLIVLHFIRRKPCS